ncbi:phosphatidate cytidylyltransferase [Binucleata daphniae]
MKVKNNKNGTSKNYNNKNIIINKDNTQNKENTQENKENTTKSDTSAQKDNQMCSLNTIHRTILTLVMIPAFLVILSLDKLYLFIFIYILKTLSYIEVVRILHVRSKNIRFEKIFVYYFMIVADLYFIGKTLGYIYIDIVPNVLVKHHLFYCFSLYIVGFIFFVLSLQKKSLKSQFAQFAVTHITIYIASIACNLSIQNIVNGKIWFAYPALLVITNDITAYIFGKSFGKRPLFKLSPKKTWEGFLGGLVCITIVGLFFCYIKIKLSTDNHSTNYNVIDQHNTNEYTIDQHNKHTNNKRSKYYNFLCDQADGQLLSKQHIICGIYIPKIYLHATCFILFASFVAPFGGFFASAFKRAFKVKDFGEVIPGHGGIMDRMDCQFLMGVFTYVYYYTFLTKRLITKTKIFDIILKNLNNEEIIELISDLRNEINK